MSEQPTQPQAGPGFHPQLRRAVRGRKPGYVSWRLQYGTFVSMQYAVMYMETPKNACSTSKMLFWKLLGLPEDDLTPARSHLREPGEGRPSVMDLEPAIGQRVLRSDRFFRFCFLRDPVDRLQSAYKNKVLDLAQDNYQPIRDTLMAEHGVPSADDLTFDMFASYAARQPNLDRDPHWQLQTDLNLMPMIEYDFVGLVERYADDMGHVLDRIGADPELAAFAGVVHNKSQDLELTLSPAVRRELESSYASDFEAIAHVRAAPQP